MMFFSLIFRNKVSLPFSQKKKKYIYIYRLMLIISNQNFVHFIFFSIIHKQPDLNALVFLGLQLGKKKHHYDL